MPKAKKNTRRERSRRRYHPYPPKRQSVRVGRRITDEKMRLFTQATENEESVFLTIHGDPLKGYN